MLSQKLAPQYLTSSREIESTASHLQNPATLRASFCQKRQPKDKFEAVATIPLAFCTAIHGLVNLERLDRGETVLIQSATGAVAFAAIQIARMCGAEISVTVGTPGTQKELLSMGLDIAEDRIFDSRSSFSAKALMDHTAGRGTDVILCSVRGELMHDYWRCIANCGRFVEIGRTEILVNGRQTSCHRHA